MTDQQQADFEKAVLESGFSLGGTGHRGDDNRQRQIAETFYRLGREDGLSGLIKEIEDRVVSTTRAHLDLMEEGQMARAAHLADGARELHAILKFLKKHQDR